MTASADVIVVGAGPTGLLCAGDLAEAGHTVILVERRKDQSNLTRAFAVHARTLELLEMRGLAERLLATGQTVPGLQLFGNIEIDLSTLDSEYPFALVTPQSNTEKVLHDRAVEHGVHMVTDTRVTNLLAGTDGGTAKVVGQNSRGHTLEFGGRYVIGTDGVGSTIRQELGVPFPGRSAVRSVMLADVRLTEPPPTLLAVNAVGRGFAFVAPFGDGWFRIIAWDRATQKEQDEPVTLDEIREITVLALGTDFGMHDARWLSRFHSDERQATAYRKGRTFLAGDAAHVHSPAGGQGMNTGLQDAANLSWKLDLVLRGVAAEELLDSYEAERHPVGAHVLRTSDTLLRAAMLEGSLARAARDIGGGLVSKVPYLAHRIANDVSGLAVSYPAQQPWGQRVPNQRLVASDAGANSLYEALRGRRFVLLEAPGSPTKVPPALVKAGLVRAQRRGASSADLVRPDGYLAWRSDDADEARREADLQRAVARWPGFALQG